MTETNLLSASDIRILRILQQDASLSISDIAKKAGMSQTPCWRRIKKLKELGIIRQISAVIDKESVGLPFVSYSFVKLVIPSRENMKTFDRMVQEWPEVVLCERITGSSDYLLRVVTSGMRGYDDFLRLKLLDNNLISEVQSRIVVSSVKETMELPLQASPAS